MNDNEYLDDLLNKMAGNEIKKERDKQRLTLEQLSKKCGVSKQNIYYYEIGRNRIKIDKYIKICEALGLNYIEILEKVALEYIKLSK